MAILHKLDRLIANEIITLTFVITASLSSIMIMAKIPRYAQLLFSAPDTGTTFLMLLLMILPSIIKFTVPISLLISASLVTIRMAADRELEAWMASGVSILRLSAMPSFIGLIVMLVSLFSALIFEPYSNKQFEKFRWVQSRKAVEELIKDSLREKSFNKSNVLDSDRVNILLYMQDISKDRSEFKNVFLAAKTSNEKYYSAIVSSAGSLKKKLNAGFPDYIFSLNKGTAYSIKQSDKSISYYLKENPDTFQLQKKDMKRNEFLSYPNLSDFTITYFSEMNISLVNTLKNKFKGDMNFTENTNQLYPIAYFEMLDKEKEKNPEWSKDTKIIEKLIFIFKQISVPISTIFLPIIGICLGIQDPRRKQFGVYLGIGVVVFVLYASISICQQLALSFVLPPFLMLFITPIALIIIIALLLRWRLRHPPSTGFIAFVRDDLLKIKIFSKKG